MKQEKEKIVSKFWVFSVFCRKHMCVFVWDKNNIASAYDTSSQMKQQKRNRNHNHKSVEVVAVILLRHKTISIQD